MILCTPDLTIALAEDVAEEIRPAFILFEFVEPADQIEAHDCSLRLYWPVLSGDHRAWIKSLCKGLTLGGAIDCAGMLVLDEDFSAGFSFKAGKLEIQPLAEPIYEYDAKKMFDKISRIYGAC